jgi:uncharacterized protein (TIRG00374 family)
MKKKFINYGLVILLLVLTFYFIFKCNNFENIYTYIMNADIKFIIMALSFMFFYKACDAKMIQITLESISEKIEFRKALKYAMIGFYYSAITPFASGGQPAQIYHMTKDQISLASSSATLIIKFVFYQSVITVYSAILFLFSHQLIKNQIDKFIVFIEIGLLINIIGVIFVFMTIINGKMVKKIADKIFNIIYKIKKVKNIDKRKKQLEDHIEEYNESLKQIGGNKKLIVQLTLLTFIQLNLFFSVSYLVYRALGLTGNSLLEFISVQALLTMAVSFIPSPGALGASEGGFIALFRMFFPKDILSTGMVLWRGITYYIVLLIGAIIALISQIRNSNKKAFLKPKKFNSSNKNNSI